jgi:Fe-S cluster assembly protein SufD
MKKIVNPVGDMVIQVKADENLELWLEDLEPGSREYNLTVELVGENAQCSVEGRSHTVGSDRKIWKIHQKFKGKNQTGNINVRGVAEGESFLQVDGAATLEHESEDSTADITERVILFDKGRSRLLPVLRVETDKVKGASHGASVAPVEYEKILYLMSRGVSRSDARVMLKDGFLR